MTDGSSTTFISTIVGIGGLIIGVITTAVRWTANLASIKAEIIDRMTTDMNKLKDEITQENENNLKQYADSFLSMSEKIRQTELWNRDNFVRLKDFERAVDSLTNRMDIGFAKLEAKLDQIHK